MQQKKPIENDQNESRLKWKKIKCKTRRYNIIDSFLNRLLNRIKEILTHFLTFFRLGVASFRYCYWWAIAGFNEGPGRIFFWLSLSTPSFLQESEIFWAVAQPQYQNQASKGCSQPSSGCRHLPKNQLKKKGCRHPSINGNRFHSFSQRIQKVDKDILVDLSPSMAMTQWKENYQPSSPPKRYLQWKLICDGWR